MLWDQIRSDYSKGMDVYLIAKKYSLATNHVGAFLGEVTRSILMGITPPNDGSEIVFSIDWQEVKRDYIDGISKDKICLKYRCLIKDLNAKLRSMGLNTRSYVANIDFNPILKLYNEGKSFKDLSKCFKIVETTLVRLFRKNKIKPRPRSEQIQLSWGKRKRIIRNANWIKVRKLYEEGESLRTIAKKCRLDRRTLINYFNQNNLMIPTSQESLDLFWMKKTGNARNHVSWQEMKKKYESGTSSTEIAKLTGYSIRTVICKLNKLGTKMKNRYECKDIYWRNYYSKIDWKSILSDYNDGLAVATLKKKYKVNIKLIKKHLLENGVKLGRRTAQKRLFDSTKSEALK